MLLLPYHIPVARPTKDIDFLGRSIDNNLGSLKKLFQEIASIDEDDGVAFTSSSVTCKRINELGEYKGVRLHVQGEVGGARFALQLDVGFGDTIVAGPIEMDFPTILDYPVPRLKVYSLESAVAEKFEAITKLSTSSSRMKDFYDIYFLASEHPFLKTRLWAALISMFKKRGTGIEKRREVFSDAFCMTSACRNFGQPS